jgi:hypothetical protein
VLIDASFVNGIECHFARCAISRWIGTDDRTHTEQNIMIRGYVARTQAHPTRNFMPFQSTWKVA